jgi:GNAT superfamily N-acetyltransferase
MSPDAFPLVDLALSRRLERAEGKSSVGFVEASAKAVPERRAEWAEWAEIGGTFALFDGPNSPITQTFGLGMFQTPTAADVEALEAFFRDRGAPTQHEVSPLADPATLTLLNERGYEPFEFTSILFRPIGGEIQLSRRLSPRVRARPIRPEERDLWADVSARGWCETPDLEELFRDLVKITAAWAGSVAFIAELDGTPIGAGNMSLNDGVALLAGACTVPHWRNQGAQLALLDARLRHAAEQGCDLAMMGALPGSASQRNAERNGFRIAYTRIKWRPRVGS